MDRQVEIDPEIAGGKPRIAGHRITVQDVVIWHEAGVETMKNSNRQPARQSVHLADIDDRHHSRFDPRVSQTELEEAALRLPEDELIALVDRLYRQVNHPLDTAACGRIRLADDRELASQLDPAGDSLFDDFVSELKASL